ncbi:MAG TPA: hypothetical protein VIG99_17195 [Myxococcaceae bacterium]|jgi:hypothetical protein
MNDPSPLSLKRVLPAGLLAGLVVNLVDIPNSALLVAPDWNRVLASQGVTPNGPAIGGYFTTVHFLYGVLVLLTYAIMRARFAPGAWTALGAAGLLLAVNRLFGFGAVVMGQMPASIWLRFSASMVLGTLLGGVAGARLYERSAPARS